MGAIVYTSPTCPYCKMVKDFLSQGGISFEERDVSRNPSYAQELVRSTGQMGVPVTIINGEITAKQGSGIILGAYVGGVRPGSVAERIGLAPGDIVTELNMKHIANADDLEDALSNLSSGSRFSLVFLRGSETMTTEGVF
jgi:glutaredoxin 3